MSTQEIYLLLADVVLVIHVLFVVFIVFGLLLIYVGRFLKWQWVRNFWLRLTHLAGIVYVVIQTWLGLICPITILEMYLRKKAGVNTYSGSFIQHWLETLLYLDLPQWVFILIHTTFGFLVLGSWFLVKPNLMRKKQPSF